MISILTPLFFVLGLIVGSFLNVVILRYNTKKSLGGRSACMSCLETLAWYELVPLVSYLGLAGRCKNCQTKISIQYPLVELASGIIFALLFTKLQSLLSISTLFFSLSYLYYAALFGILIVIAAYDLKHKIIPDQLSFILGLLALLGVFLFRDHMFDPHIPFIFDLLIGPLVALPFALLWLISRGRWMGLGDAKLIIGLAYLLGAPLVFYALVIAFWLGAIIGIVLILTSRAYGMKSEIPFAPYLILGTMLVFFSPARFLFFGF